MQFLDIGNIGSYQATAKHLNVQTFRILPVMSCEMIKSSR